MMGKKTGFIPSKHHSTAPHYREWNHYEKPFTKKGIPIGRIFIEQKNLLLCREVSGAARKRTVRPEIWFFGFPFGFQNIKSH